MLLRKLLIDETDHWFPQLIRYVFVGGLAFVVDYGLLFLLTEYAYFHYLLSATLSFIAGLFVNYLISIRWVFRCSKLSNRLWEFVIFSIIGIIGLGINALFLYLLTEYLHLHYLVSKLIVAAIVMLWNFLARRITLFTGNKSQSTI